MILGKDPNFHKYRLNRDESYPQSMVIVDCGPVTYRRILTAIEGDLHERFAVSHSSVSNTNDTSLKHQAKYA